ncbi:alpha/beta-hydrolase [Hesseltinella vesiculosa]|uniref:Alpha/beta-hydrolase n=1 Tax=Hesseltinella vesiculosa TaxID=101127 RepID=A0A1X2GX58_9FUNG|nr:alpha/beta-hydrolase [Hesseltinella vesiculosa]
MPLIGSNEKLQVVKAIAAVTVAAGLYCVFLDPWQIQKRSWHRLTFFLCQRNLQEQDLERQVLQQKEPSLLSDNTQYVEINQHKLRIVHIIHELGNQVPLIVFIHGLGGQAEQWQRQIEYFSKTAHVLAIDLLGCGQSEVSLTWQDYTSSSLVQDIEVLLRERYTSAKTVIISHSYGCAIASYIAAKPWMLDRLQGLVLISAKGHMDEQQKNVLRKLAWVPDWIFDVARTADRRGGLYSASIERGLGPNVPESMRRLQLKWNLESRTSVYKRIVCGAQFPTQDVYDQIASGVLLIGGSDDQIVPPTDMNRIRQYLLRTDSSQSTSTRVPEPYIVPDAGHLPMLVKPELVNPVISDFLINNCKLETLSGEWQILNKTQGENIWDLKNYEKWSRTANITMGPIGISKFRAMKVMRQTDPEHSPAAFMAKFPEIGFIIDLSKDTPPYRASDFEQTNVEYNKFKTVSKIPPTRDDVRRFIALADQCWQKRPDVQVAVHCHYGFNRTGFFICCYMIERLGVSVPEALDAFASMRPPGIRHAHFIDELYLRYVVHHR